jgi:hypothetical protein
MASKQMTNTLYWATVIIGHEAPGSYDFGTVSGALEMAALDAYDSGIRSIYTELGDILAAYHIVGGLTDLNRASDAGMSRAIADNILTNTTSLA